MYSKNEIPSPISHGHPTTKFPEYEKYWPHEGLHHLVVVFFNHTPTGTSRTSGQALDE